VSRFEAIDHVSVPVGDVDEAVHFYGEVLGLAQIDRPDFGFPGAWFGTGTVPLHLTTGSKRRSEPHLAANEAHIAFRVDGTEDLVARLRRADIEIYELENSPAANAQLFFHDPWGNMLEIIDY
jgi:glyoxylase I family protein